MRQALSKFYIKTAILTSVLISILGVLNLIIQSKEPFGLRYYTTVFVVIEMCLFNWGLLLGADYIFRVRKSGYFSKITLISIYYILGILNVLVSISLVNHCMQRYGMELHVPDNYFYRRLFAGFILSSVILLIKYTLTLFAERERMMLENERLLRENLQARFETLRQQVNPHFLFNSLSTLKTMMHNDIDKAEEYLLRLSDVFRYSLQTSTVEKVALREELNILDAYLFMLKGRFGENLIIDIQIDKHHLDMFVPPFTFQIIVENCVKHNIVSGEKPLLIKIYSNPDDHITISNSRQPKNSVETSSRVGLANIEKRYQYLSGQHIEIIESDIKFDVIIPLIPSK